MERAGFLPYFREIIGGDMLHMDLHGEWNHNGVERLHLYVDVYFNDEDEAVTYWLSDYAVEMYAFVSAVKCAMDMVLGGQKSGTDVEVR